MKSMCDKAHSLGMKCGFYMNNCICKEGQFKDPDMIDKIYRSSVEAMVEWGYDAVKIDGCSQFHNISYWAQLMNETGRPFEIENCHDSHTDPTTISSFGEVCPFNWYRSSSDINPSWDKVWYNFQSVRQYSTTKPPLSRPGCWAYPDMLEVGQMKFHVEDRTHFGAWCITSSPLILGYDLNKEEITDSVWDIITNEPAIAVNQAWSGSPGHFVRDLQINNSQLGASVNALNCTSTDPTQTGWAYDASKNRVTLTSHSYYGQMLAQCLDGSRGRENIVQDCRAKYGAEDDKLFCVDHANGKNLEMRPCQDTDTQFFEYDGNQLRDKKGQCVDVWAGHGLPGGPGVQMFKCHNASNQEFQFKDGHVVEKAGLCFAVRRGQYGALVQLWAKPLPCKGCQKVAAFVASNLGVDGSGNALQNFTYTFDLVDDLGLNQGEVVEVYDVWRQKSLGTHNERTFSTDPFGGHDSRFYVFTTTGGVTEI